MSVTDDIPGINPLSGGFADTPKDGKNDEAKGEQEQRRSIGRQRKSSPLAKRQGGLR
jgi:hypothetical protein